jgi:hypothetical protein
MYSIGSLAGRQSRPHRRTLESEVSRLVWYAQFDNDTVFQR